MPAEGRFTDVEVFGGDPALIFAAVLVLLRDAASSVRRPVALLVAGVLCLCRMRCAWP